MASEGPNSPGTMANDATVGGEIWSNVDNAKVEDGSYASAFTAFGTNYLKATNFSFSIPTGATINGIFMEAKCNTDGNDFGKTTDIDVKIVKSDDSFGTTDKSSATEWGDSGFVYISHGSSSDLWGESWAATDINSSNFGVVIAVGNSDEEGWVDHIRITVTYTEVATGTGQFINIGDNLKEISEIYVNIGDAFKLVSETYINIGDVFKRAL